MSSDTPAPATLLGPAEFVERWGDGLVQPRAEAVSVLRAPEDAKVFLVQAGLPQSAAWDLVFEFPDGSVPRLRLALGAAGRKLPRDFDRYRRLGRDAATHICLDEGAEGRIVAVGLEPWREIPVRLVSSSVAQLAEALLHSRDFREDREDLRGWGASEDKVADLVRSFRDRLHRADPRAMADHESFFAVIVEQIETGLL